MRVVVIASILSCAAALLGGCGTDTCDPDGLAEALADAEPGDTVEVEACEVRGSFTVPAGVTLRGAGRGQTILVAGAGQVGVTLTPGSSAAALRDVTVRSEGRAGVLARGAGSVVVAGTAIEAVRGIGFGLDQVTSLEATDVWISGPVTDDGSLDASDVDPTKTATHGLVLSGVAQATLARVSITGFAAVGALAVGGNTTWNGGGAPRNAGVGAWFDGGRATLTGVDVSETFGSSLVVAGVLVTGAADVTSQGLVIGDGKGYGLVTAGAAGRHVGLVAQGNRDVAVWVQDSASFELSGDSKITANKLAGVAVVHSSNVTLEGVTVAKSDLATKVVGETGSVQVGDGIELVGSTKNIRLASLTLTDNDRAGLVIDLEGAAADGIAIEGVSVSGSGTMLGAVFQGGLAPPGWDAIDRKGDTKTNDPAFQGKGTELGMLGPNTFPPTNPADIKGMLGPNT